MTPFCTKTSGAVKFDRVIAVTAGNGTFKAAVSIKCKNKPSAINGGKAVDECMYAEEFEHWIAGAIKWQEHPFGMQSTGIYQSDVTGRMIIGRGHDDHLRIY